MVMEEQESDMELVSESTPVPRIQQPELNIVKRNHKSGVSRGKPRLRKKALHNAILQQMEFYFSDANLNKDRYLSELLKKSPYVDLNIFTNFNKLSSLTTDINRIAKALQKSTMLKVSEDGTKVYRLTPINKKENIDECTVYVQNLPPDADHDWLISLFSKYGPVVYVSIPRYKSNKKIKGFAFIEFDTPVGAKKCIKAFQEKGRVLPSHMSPNDLLSITTFENADKNLILYDKQEHTHVPKEIVATDKNNEKQKILRNQVEDDNIIHDNKVDKSDNIVKQILGKRKLASEKSVTDESDIKSKKKKSAVDESMGHQESDENKLENQDIPNKITETDKKRKRKLMTNEVKFTTQDSKEKKVKKDSCAQIANENEEIEMESINKDDNNDNEQNESQIDKHSLSRNIDVSSSDIEEKEIGVDDRKKKKTRKKRSKIQDITYNATGLQVMTKRDWKCLRNKYLEIQKSKMQQLKLHLRKARWNYDKVGQSYEKSKNEKDNGKSSEAEKSSGHITYVPGIIVKIDMDEPCTDPQSLKSELRDNNYIKYVDVTHDSCVAYIRCDTAESAQTFVQKNYEGRHSTILEGDEEKSYWTKIEQDREEKLGNKKKFKHRGRDKLLKRAEKELGKCIKFDQV